MNHLLSLEVLNIWTLYGNLPYFSPSSFSHTTICTKQLRVC